MGVGVALHPVSARGLGQRGRCVCHGRKPISSAGRSVCVATAAGVSRSSGTTCRGHAGAVSPLSALEGRQGVAGVALACDDGEGASILPRASQFLLPLYFC